MKSLLLSSLFLFFGVKANSQVLDSTTVKKFLEKFAEPAGEIISGSVLSTANTHGGIPHFAGGAGVGFLSVKTTNPIDTTQEFRSVIPTSFLYGSLGITKGLQLGPGAGGIGSLDLLARFGFFPMRGDYGDVADKSPLLYGGGVKVGLLRHGIVSPAISGTTTYTFLKDAEFTFTSAGDVGKTSFDLSTWSIHFDVSKSFLIVAPYLGLGWDFHRLKASYEVNFSDPLLPDQSGAYTVKPKTSRFYGGGELTLALLKFYLEGGKTGDHGYFSIGAKAGI